MVAWSCRICHVGFCTVLHCMLILQVKVKRSYPLTAVESVEYDEESNPLQFQLIFSTYIMSLVAESAEEARDWVEKINGGKI